MTTQARDAQEPARPAGVMGFYLVAVMSMLVSIDTSWRYFAQNLHIADLRERIVMFAVIEVALIACGYGMRANVIRSGRPGAPRLFAWVLCVMAGYMAWQLSGVAEGVARVALGPALGLVMLHLALGIEIRAGRHTSTTWTRIGRELRERLLSRLGLADDTRDALAHTRERAARRVARLSLTRVVLFRSARLARALRTSNVAHDPDARDRMLTELAAIRHAADLATLDQYSPWHSTPADTALTVTSPAGEPLTNPVADGVAPTDALVHEPVRERVHEPVRAARKPARRKPPAKAKRVTYGDYLTRAREALTPGVMPTAKWAQDVTGCSSGTSVKLARQLRDELVAQTTPMAIDASVTVDRQVA